MLAAASPVMVIEPNVPSEVVITLLTLAEFMEHDEKPLPIDPKMLGDYVSLTDSNISDKRLRIRRLL